MQLGENFTHRCQVGAVRKVSARALLPGGKATSMGKQLLSPGALPLAQVEVGAGGFLTPGQEGHLYFVSCHSVHLKLIYEMEI